MSILSGNWEEIRGLGNHSYECGYCGVLTGGKVGYKTHNRDGLIFICAGCNRPTFFENNFGNQNPSPHLGNDVEHLPENISSLYNEARRCTQVQAYTSCILACRKLLMHIAVDKGAPEGEPFIKYVEFLTNNHFIPHSSIDWIDQIRTIGNEANHEIVAISKEGAIELLTFVEMLLKIVYEFPARISSPNE